MTILYYIVNQKRNNFLGHRPPPPPSETRRHLYQTRMCTNIYIMILWEWGLVLRGGFHRGKMWLFDHGCVI